MIRHASHAAFAEPAALTVDRLCCTAGESCGVWRYFESVPEELSSMRTHEAAAVADRHLRYVFCLSCSLDGACCADMLVISA
jgi:hypothetical protein